MEIPRWRQRSRLDSASIGRRLSVIEKVVDPARVDAPGRAGVDGASGDVDQRVHCRRHGGRFLCPHESEKSTEERLLGCRSWRATGKVV